MIVIPLAIFAGTISLLLVEKKAIAFGKVVAKPISQFETQCFK